MTKKYFSLISRIPAWENGDEGEGEGDSKVETFTQEQVNTMMAEQKKKIKAQSSEIVTNLQTQLESHKGTEAEKIQLRDRIKKLKEENQTAAERTASKHSDVIQSMQSELDAANQKSDKGWNLYTTARSKSDLLTAATGAEAIVPSLVMDVLNPFTSLEESTDDDGKPTGNFDVIVSLPVTDSEGVTKVQKLSAAEAVTAMKKMANKYGPLFKSTATGGTGGNNTSGSGTGKLTDVEFYELAKTDPEAFQKEYKKRQGFTK